MNPALISLIAIVVLVVAYVVGLFIVRRYRRYDGQMVVTCPETNRPVGVELDAPMATLGDIVGRKELMLTECTRWPERADCDQACTLQIAVDLERARIATRLAEWSHGQSCAFCERPIGGDVDHLRAGLLAPDGSLVEWKDVRGDRLDDVMATHRAVCTNCGVAETFRRRFPELVIDAYPVR
jgi:hypothetical protein